MKCTANSFTCKVAGGSGGLSTGVAWSPGMLSSAWGHSWWSQLCCLLWAEPWEAAQNLQQRPGCPQGVIDQTSAGLRWGNLSLATWTHPPRQGQKTHLAALSPGHSLAEGRDGGLPWAPPTPSRSLLAPRQGCHHRGHLPGSAPSAPQIGPPPAPTPVSESRCPNPAAVPGWHPWCFPKEAPDEQSEPQLGQKSADPWGASKRLPAPLFSVPAELLGGYSPPLPGEETRCGGNVTCWVRLQVSREPGREPGPRPDPDHCPIGPGAGGDSQEKRCCCCGGSLSARGHWRGQRRQSGEIHSETETKFPGPRRREGLCP